ncbi:MAG: tetratricopeptide repeat protein [Limnochordia bacterium]|jgi:Flp pilus assembly protein TadD
MTVPIEDLYAEALEKLDRWDLEAAEGLLRKVLAIDPEHAKAVNKLGVVYARRDELGPAEELFEQAIALDPNDPGPYCNLGNIYAQREWNDRAKDLYEKALALDPEHPNALHNLGVIHRRAGDIGKSVELLKRAARAERAQRREELRQSPKARRTALVGWAVVIAIVLFILYITRR